jgi:2-C-methyl-D-erythritol 4-phosphate cytidylyltransferase / 2-C-methyl-D-erythritol 2,4-cyclodiphosphate synthase
MINITAAIIAGAGSGHRLGADLPKALVKLLDKTLVEHAVAALAPVAELIIVTAPAGFEDKFKELLGDQVTVITGGVLRSDSIRIALENIPNNYEFVLVHDAARAIASTDLAKNIVSELVKGEQAVIPALDVMTQLKRLMQVDMCAALLIDQHFVQYKHHKVLLNQFWPMRIHQRRMQLMMQPLLRQLELR